MFKSVIIQSERHIFKGASKEEKAMQARDVSADGVIYALAQTADLIISVFCLCCLLTHCQHFPQISSSPLPSPPSFFVFIAVIFLLRFFQMNKQSKTNKQAWSPMSLVFHLCVSVCLLLFSNPHIYSVYFSREPLREREKECESERARKKERERRNV